MAFITICLVYKTYQAQKREIKRLTDESRNTEIQHMLIAWIFPKHRRAD